MFWGLILKANKKYTQILEKPFHLSQAALDHSSSSDEPIQVMYNHEDASYLLCTLQKGSVMQCALDLNFAEGDKLCFSTKGNNGIVHLTGFLVPDEDLNYGELDDESEEGSEIEMPDLREKLSKNKTVKKSSKNDDDDEKVQESGSEEDDSDDEDLSAIQNDDDDESEEEEEESDDDEEDESSEDEIEPPKAKQQKLEPQQIKEKDKKQQNGLTNGQDKKQKNQQQAGQMQKLQGGLMCQDLKIGNGAEAKVGKKIQVYYEGRLKDNNKVFDAAKNPGPGFKLTLGRGEVIKGWDIGLQGMKVGGKRRLIIPPGLAYGKKGNRPVIPPNAELVFDIELKNVF